MNIKDLAGVGPEQLVEAGFRDVTGWSKRDIQRMGHEDDAAPAPSKYFKVIDGRMKIKWVYPDQASFAEHDGWRPDQTKALKHAHIVRSKFHQGKYVKNEGGKWIEVFPFGNPEDIAESATAGATSSANIATVANPDYANNANSKPVKSVNALDQDDVSLFGAPMETMKNVSGKKAAIIKRR